MVYVVENGQLGPSDGNTIIERSLADLQKRFGVRINQNALAGYIIDLDQADANKQYDGFDLDALIDEPMFAPWFHNPYPKIAGSEERMEKVWTYATTGVGDKSEFQKLNFAVAYTAIDHVFFPLNKFKYGFYFDESRNQSTNQGLESVLHEALHIWDYRNHGLVLKLLKSPGSYYDRVAISKRICPSYTKISSLPDDKPTCGFSTELKAMFQVLKKAKWPQRYGSLTARKKARIKDQYGCASIGRETTMEGETVCLGENKGDQMGDLHAIDNEAEYFAILMQLYVFSPKDFQNIATPVERAFARRIFRKVFQ